jgi:hypothetical protein
MHRNCRLKEIVAEPERCPGKLCAFWDRGSCALERIDLRGRAELAGFLLDLRGELESFRDREQASAARRLFFQRLNAGRSD